AALLVMGRRRPPHFTEPQPPAFDEWDAKSLACTLAYAAYPGAMVDLAPGSARAGELWRVTANGEVVGTVSRVALAAPVWASPAFGVEVPLGIRENAMVAPRGTHAHASRDTTAPGGAPVRYRPLPTTPAAEFDLALVVPDGMVAAQVESVMREAAG